MDVGDKVNDERALFEAWARPQPYWWNGQTYSDLHTQVAWEAWQAARRTPSASIGEDGLPELPKAAHRGPDGTGSYFDSYTADQMRQYAREAVAADRRARDVAPKAARGVEVQAMADCMDMVWQELIEAGVIDKSVPPMMIADAVVAQFAATTANLQTAVQQAWKANAELSKLRGAPPLSSEPQAEKGAA